MGQIYEAVTAKFTATEQAIIDEAAYVDEDGGRENALLLVVGWVAHVNKIDNDRVLSWDDHSVWNEYDLVAAVIIRDRAKDALVRLPSMLAERLMESLAEADERFRSFTVEDSGVRITRIANLEAPDTPVPDDWWWHRVPVDGPIAIDLSHYDAEGNYVGGPDSLPE